MTDDLEHQCIIHMMSGRAHFPEDHRLKKNENEHLFSRLLSYAPSITSASAVCQMGSFITNNTHMCLGSYKLLPRLVEQTFFHCHLAGYFPNLFTDIISFFVRGRAFSAELAIFKNKNHKPIHPLHCSLLLGCANVELSCLQTILDNHVHW